MEKNNKKRAVSIFEDGRRVITMKDGKEVHEEVV